MPSSRARLRSSVALVMRCLSFCSRLTRGDSNVQEAVRVGDWTIARQPKRRDLAEQLVAKTAPRSQRRGRQAPLRWAPARYSERIAAPGWSQRDIAVLARRHVHAL